MQTKQLSKLEQVVMSILWQTPELSVREVRDRLATKRRLAYTTVATILDRLHKKDLVKKILVGTVIVYAPSVSQVSYSKNIARTFVDNFVSAFGDIAIASFADTLDHLPKAKKRYLLKLLDENK